MSGKRKSAFSVYKMQELNAKRDESVQINESFDSEMEKFETTGKRKQSSLPSGARKKNTRKNSSHGGSTEAKEESDKPGTKPFSRTSRLRHSIGNIGLNKKRRKMPKTQEPEIAEEIHTEKDCKRARRTTISCSSDMCKLSYSSVGIPATLHDHEAVLNRDVESLPKKTFTWLISPVKTDKFFRYSYYRSMHETPWCKAIQTFLTDMCDIVGNSRYL